MNKNIIKDYTNQIIDIWKKESLNSPILNSKMNHSKRVAQYIQLLTKNDNNSFYGWIHDIGRIEQYHKIKCFDDNRNYNGSLMKRSNTKLFKTWYYFFVTLLLPT